MDTIQPTVHTTSRGKRADTQFLKQRFTKVVIQEIPTRCYWGAGGVWTRDIDEATAFDSSSAAQEVAREQGFQNVQLVLNRVLKEWEIIPFVPCAKTIEDLLGRAESQPVGGGVSRL